VVSDTPLIDALMAAQEQRNKDAEDGRALRELREAWSQEWDLWVRPGEAVEVGLSDEGRWTRYHGPTIAAAADAAREALRDA
jgi:hypothetical protein